MNPSSSSSTTTTTTTTNRNTSTWGYYTNLLLTYMTEPNPLEETRRTISNLTNRFGDTHPTFRNGIYTETVSFARSKFKFLIIYVHSSKNPNANSFCKDVLFTREFKEFIDEHFVFWACDINTSLGLRISNFLKATSYPFLSMISCNNIPGLTSTSDPVQLESFQDTQLLTKQSTIDAIRDHFAYYEPSLISAKADNDLREQDRFIRQEQDEEYLKSLKADQEKERIRLEKLEQERLEREREEQEERERLEFENRLLERKENKKKYYQVEPSLIKGSNDVTKLVIRLHDGSKIQRNFLISSTIEYVMDYIDTLIQEPIEHYVLSTNFPKKRLTNLSVTLKDESLYPDAVLFLSEN
ncbi:hypothetical protein DICPUDRAFT_77902 [Dictyostelium purpureum]|uniref:UBX domain-containing protein n=1 Tax=Dictyostelium purpureum TaxID=5786 RepID=F0ZHZ1_DICPU|nr:uncharacterized protein DICPUDRAFT_77902 [Dictyostelium purpureum]EGC36455.1 hypothetical protein DICPUDRAFT_77902 [Dictyostelium purpureum]|eukprot:XP_003287027.1 hypothetical protein DICPUDRAFT_77902 [Dictyostelium purpureum]